MIAIPREILVGILDFLNVMDYMSFSHTCKEYKTYLVEFTCGDIYYDGAWKFAGTPLVFNNKGIQLVSTHVRVWFKKRIDWSYTLYLRIVNREHKLTMYKNKHIIHQDNNNIVVKLFYRNRIKELIIAMYDDDESLHNWTCIDYDYVMLLSPQCDRVVNYKMFFVKIDFAGRKECI